MPASDDISGDALEARPGAAPRLRAWLELLRVPNLLTVPGDPIVGFLLAGAESPHIAFTRVVPCALASLLLYCAGLISNDLFDLAEDRRERPRRPLPSGRIRSRTAAIVCMVLFAVAVGVAGLAGRAATYIAAALVVFILLYNAFGKRIPLLGPLNMGICRALSLMLGAAAFGTAGLHSPVLLVAAAGLTLYVTGVTLVAARETTGRPPGVAALLPGFFIILWFAGLCLTGPFRMRAGFVWALALVMGALLWAGRLGGMILDESDPQKVSRAVGGFLRTLLPIQAGIAAMTLRGPGAWVALALLAAWPVSWLLGRRFYAS